MRAAHLLGEAGPQACSRAAVWDCGAWGQALCTLCGACMHSPNPTRPGGGEQGRETVFRRQAAVLESGGKTEGFGVGNGPGRRGQRGSGSKASSSLTAPSVLPAVFTSRPTRRQAVRV